MYPSFPRKEQISKQLFFLLPKSFRSPDALVLIHGAWDSITHKLCIHFRESEAGVPNHSNHIPAKKRMRLSRSYTTTVLYCTGVFHKISVQVHYGSVPLCHALPVLVLIGGKYKTVCGFRQYTVQEVLEQPILSGVLGGTFLVIFPC